MHMPRLDDTIVAVSSGWEPSPLGIVRLSGPLAFAIAGKLGVGNRRALGPTSSGFRDAELALRDQTRVPASIFWFTRPNSYTGQDLVELHAPGNLSLLRELCTQLIQYGARRALPGEFTARAFLNGRIDSRQVEGVLGLITADSESSARQAARAARQSQTARVAQFSERLGDLVARVEAGIDFTDEEDVRFITPAELLTAIQAIEDGLGADGLDCEFTPPTLPHVALAGLPNAGKSTLFNALLGQQRAIVSPVLGTTRDVISAPVRVAEHNLILQDTAGLSDSSDDLTAATHLAAERNHDRADFVMWVHDRSHAWTPAETAACRQIPPQRRALVLSKCDRGAAERHPSPEGVSFTEVVEVSAVTRAGLDRLRAVISTNLDRICEDCHVPPSELVDGEVLAALRRAASLIERDRLELTAPDLVALELRYAWQLLCGIGPAAIVEDVLSRIYNHFCVGK